MTIIDFKNVSKIYGENEVLVDFNLHIDKGEFLVLVGPSGCGKTTILKMINGLLLPDKGEIRVKDKLLSDWDLIELRRGIGYVIQQIGLLPHMTIEENINYVPSLTKTDEKVKKQTALELIELVGMDESFLKRYPTELSGGQQQRIGVARALAAKPEIILMDEPFGAVDEITRRILQDEIIKIHKKLKKTIVFVTHDIEEAVKLGTRIVLLNEGKIERDDNKKDFILSKDKSDYAKLFFKSKDFIAYLNTISVDDIIKEENISNNPVMSEPDILELHRISADSSVLEAVQRCIETNSTTLRVVRSNDEFYGFFDIDKIYEKL